jgi:ADP-ribose pyrophosphatase YjhB (NUDIX family)
LLLLGVTIFNGDAFLDKIDAGFLPWPEFERAVGALPLVSVDWVLLNPAGQMLLGHRRNAPARHWWFTPGGRVRKNEPLASCLQRVAGPSWGCRPVNWGQIPIVLMFREPSGSFSVSGVCFVQRADNCGDREGA